MCAFRITAKCTKCGICLEPCPTGSIFVGDGIYAIDSDTCDNSQVCVTLCPENAIVEIKDELAERQARLLHAETQPHPGHSNSTPKKS